MKKKFKVILPVITAAAIIATAGTAYAIQSRYSVDDISNTQKYIIGKSDSEDVSSADLNTDGKTDAGDLALMKRNYDNAEAATDDSDGNKILVAYFSPAENSGTDTISSATLTSWNGQDMGAAQILANMIHNDTKSDIFSIKTDVNYPLEYSDLATYARNEKDNNVLPNLTSHIENLDQYDTVIVVFPVWWYTMPQAVRSFFNEYDFSGKTIIPCTTHAGSGLAGSPATIRELEPNATVIDDGFSVSASRVVRAENDVATWVENSGLNK